jgi:hypothetical protein
VESFSLELAQKHRNILEKAAAMWNAIPARPGNKEGEVSGDDIFKIDPGASHSLQLNGESVG